MDISVDTGFSSMSKQAFKVLVSYLERHFTRNRLPLKTAADEKIVRELLKAQGELLESRLRDVDRAGVKVIKEILDWLNPTILIGFAKSGVRRDSKDHAIVLALRYAGVTLFKIGELYGVQAERVRQIEAKAIRKLRHSSRSKPLREYID